MCRGGRVEDEVGAARQEKRKTSEKIHGCSEGGHAEEDAGTGGGGEDWKKNKVYWCGEDNPSYFLRVVVFRGGFAGREFLKNLHLFRAHISQLVKKQNNLKGKTFERLVRMKTKPDQVSQTSSVVRFPSFHTVLGWM